MEVSQNLFIRIYATLLHNLKAFSGDIPSKQNIFPHAALKEITKKIL